VQIFYARLAPTVLDASTTVSIDAITTSNVTRVQVGTSTSALSLSQVGPGKWQGTFQAARFGLGPAQPIQQLTLYAYRSDGGSTNIQIPVSTH
jgi:hypothetical protein